MITSQTFNPHGSDLPWLQDEAPPYSVNEWIEMLCRLVLRTTEQDATFESPDSNPAKFRAHVFAAISAADPMLRSAEGEQILAEFRKMKPGSYEQD